VWWAGGDDDARPAGAAAKGYSSLTFNAAGSDFPALQDVLKLVVAKGKSSVAAPEKVGEMLYNRGIFNSVLMAEAIRTAQQLTGKKVITGEDMRRGLETLNLSADRLKEIGLADFAAPLHVTCSDHSGHHSVYLAVWDGQKWTKGSDWIEPIKDKVLPLIEQDAQKYATSNPGWPKRTEACDKSS
jgi:branched-chain amino acid transport system substrate-binding protein